MCIRDRSAARRGRAAPRRGRGHDSVVATYSHPQGGLKTRLDEPHYGPAPAHHGYRERSILPLLSVSKENTEGRIQTVSRAAKLILMFLVLAGAGFASWPW